MQLRRKPIAAAITGGITDGLTGPIVGAAAANQPTFQELFTDATNDTSFDYTRATTQYVETDTGALYPVPAGAIPIQNARPVRSLVNDVVPTAESTSFSAWTAVNMASISGDGLTVSLPAAGDTIRLDVSTDGVQNGRTYAAAFWLTGNGTLTLRVRDRFGAGPDDIGDQVVTLTSTPQRFSVAHQFSDDNTNGIRVYLLHGTSDTATEAVLQSPGYLIQEITHRAALSTAPDEYVDSATDHGTGVNGFRYFTTALANTVDGSGVVTEGTGAALTGIALANVPRATNLETVSGGTSQTFNATAVSDGASIVAGQDRIRITATAGFAMLYSLPELAASTDYCLWRYLEAGTTDWAYIRTRAKDTTNSATCFDLANGAIGTVNHASAGMREVSAGVYLCWVVFNAATGGTVPLVGCGPAIGDGNFSTSTETIYSHHRQTEAGTLPTAPIVTSGSTASTDAAVLDFSGVTGFVTPNETRIVATGLNASLEADPTDTTERNVDADDWDGTDLSDLVPHGNIISVTQYAPGERP